MNNVVQKLITARQSHGKSALKEVSVKKLAMGLPNRCYQNACMIEEMDPTAMMVSGWLVGPYDPVAGITPIIAHWWNFDGDQYIDATPTISDDWIYVLDLNVMRYAYAHDDELDSHVPSSLAYTINGFLVAVGNIKDELEFHPIEQLTDEALFQHCRFLPRNIA